jgi:hypothetical protein
MNLQPSILAVGFTNLAMLGWLAAAAAPLLIHLWSRHRFREAPWAAMQFLLAAMRKNARRMQLQQWLLLALRTLLIVLVVLAVAEPYGERLVAGGASAPAHKVLVIDGSLSMAYRDNGASHFERAKKLAADLVHDSRAGDAFTVILMATPARIVVGRQTVGDSALVAHIGALEQTHTAADLPSVIAVVQKALNDHSNDRVPRQRHEVHFFTDLQRTTWQFTPRPQAGPAMPADSKSQIRSPQVAIADLAGRAALFIVDVGRVNAANLAVTRLDTAEPLMTVNREVPWDVTLHQFGAEPRTGCRVELLVDEVAVAERTVNVPAGGEATVHFTHRFTSPGDHTMAVRAAGDQLEPDNARWLVVPVRDEIRVLCVEGRDGAAKYIAGALNPGLSTPSAIRPTVVAEGDLSELSLTDFDCIFLSNLPQLTASEAQRIAQYVAAGGGLVFFLGDRVIPDAYNHLVAGSEAVLGNEPLALVPARIGELVDEPRVGVDPLEYRHPIVAPFRGNERAGLLTTPVSRYYRLEVPETVRHGEVAATIGRGDPFIVAAPLGKGRTVVVATDGSLSSVDAATGEPWTIWPTWPSFLPIVRELLAYAVSGMQHDWQQPVGTPIASEGKLIAGATPKVLRPDGRTAPVALHIVHREQQWIYRDTELAGIYSLASQSPIASKRFARNVDTRESDITRIELEDLPREFVVRSTSPAAEDGAPSTLVAHAAWSGRLLWLAFALLFVESFLAWRFGRGTA